MLSAQLLSRWDPLSYPVESRSQCVPLSSLQRRQAADTCSGPYLSDQCVQAGGGRKMCKPLPWFTEGGPGAMGPSQVLLGTQSGVGMQCLTSDAVRVPEGALSQR